MCLVALFIYAFAFPISTRASEVGGRVIGPTGDPIQGARVYALSADSPGTGRRTEVLTGSKGEFLLKDVRDGQNEIHAYAPEIGYADNLFAVFQTAPVPVVRVKVGAAVHGIVVRLGPKPGTLSGEVLDANTRKPLPTASVTLSWANRPEYTATSSIGPDARFSYKVPAHPLLISVTCVGYRTWKSAATTVSSGGTYHMVVAMTK